MRRVSQVSEQYRQRADGNLLAGTERLAGEEIAEDLQGRDFSRSCRFVTPDSALQNEELFVAGRILETNVRVLGN